MLCMSGHARHVPEASADCHSQPALSRDRQTRTMVQKVSCCVCCQGIQLESSSISLTLQSGSSPSHSFPRLSSNN